MDSGDASERLRQGFTPQGIFDSVAGPLLFLVLYRTAGLDPP